MPGVADPFSGVSQDETDSACGTRANARGAGRRESSDIAGALAAGMQGTIGTTIAERSMQVPVRVAVTSAGYGVPSSLALASGPVPLAQLARTSLDRTTTDVEEINGQRVTRRFGQSRVGTLSSAVAGVRSAIVGAGLPPGYARRSGAPTRRSKIHFASSPSQSGWRFCWSSSSCWSPSGRFAQPLVMLAAVAFAPIGVAIALAITRTPFNVRPSWACCCWSASS